MSTGIVVYGTSPTQVVSTLEVAEDLFRQLGSAATRAVFLKFVVRGAERTIDDQETSLPDLRSKISTGEVSAFQVFSDEKTVDVPTISFGCNVPEFGGLSFIDVQIERAVCEINKEIEKFLENVVARLSCKYAIAYDAEKSSIAYKYSTGVNLVRIFPFENTSLFTRELPGRVPGSASYERERLRMIYPLNVLNENHLKICVDGISLREWIVSDSSRGSLRSIPNNMWLWTVDDADLTEVNNACGEAGILLAWQKPPASKPVRRLP
ncbi:MULTISPECIES: hypothetical protein [Burkholderia]|uniref:hypothetical protein n=1 Tax=Burkholderia TaxID=32008 RepID=UPI000A706347|nr:MULTISPECIES: hypothetical protein [Burkholderia]MDF3094686.1 hypothetical protein [Burkholderia semiarida]MDF3104711.1 hypothetical protein [Burkholderia semiarida]WJN74942.1 hypothetical protein OH687_32015 [Burkholderia anthina]